MNPRLGIGFKVASVLGFTVMSGCVKLASGTMPIGEVAFFRSFFAMLTILAILAWRDQLPMALHTANPWGHVWRGSVALTSMICNFTGISLLPLPDAIAIGYATPLFLTMFAALLLGEVVRLFRWTAVAVGLLGVLIILWPRMSLGGSMGELAGAAASLTGAASGAIGAIIASRLVQGERTSTIVFYFSAMCSLGFGLTLPFAWATPDLATLAVMILSGILGGVAQIWVTESYRHAATSTVAPFEYTSMLFSIAIGFAVFGELPTSTMLLGSVVVMASSMIVIWREHQLRLDPMPPSGFLSATWPWGVIGAEEEG